MDSEARGEVTAPVVLRDEDGQTLAFLSLRVIHDGAEVFLLAEREGAPERDPERAIAFGVTGGGRIEPVADERFLADLHALLEDPGRTVGSAS